MGSALSRFCGRGDDGPRGWVNNMGSALSGFWGRGDDGPEVVEVQFPELIQNQAVETSSGDDNDVELELEPKHKIFLSHSGAQKDFTEQLCVDLERALYYPFFDKRHDSLPKGKKFPELIFKAAQQCRVAVLVLSEEFFTRSKWPMLELESFVEAQQKDPKKIDILPVYLGLSRDECTKNEARHLKWVSVWRKWAEGGERINVEKWVKSLRVLGPSNGIEYMQSFQGEVNLREQIVNAIRGLVPPEVNWSAGQIEGRTRICKIILEKLRSTKPSDIYGVRVVGIYGTGGVGKTTFCKVLCDELCTEFQGRVCHGELGSKSQLEMHRQVLMGLTDVSDGSLTSMWDDDKTTNLLHQHLRRHQVFLALDNVWQDSIEKAKLYLGAGFHLDSIVMVTARSLDVLASLKIMESDCLEMPELHEVDATQLFLHHAAPGVEFKSKVDEERILYCVKLCKFRKGVNMSEHFLPLALKVLGAQLGSLESNPEKWVENLKNLPKDERFNQFGEREHPIFGVLRRGYDTLSDGDQLLFMDVVIFRPRLVLNSFSIHQRIVFKRVSHSQTTYFREWSSIDLYEWLSIVHQTTVRRVKHRVQGLKAKSLIENMGNYGVSIHDLYIEFAQMEVQRGALDSRCWMWYDCDQAHAEDVTLMPSGNCWQNIRRVHLRYDEDQRSEDIERIKWKHFSNIVVLTLFVSKIEVLDLRGLQCLRSLGVTSSRHFRRLRREEGKIVGLGGLKKLAWLALCYIKSASFFEEIGSLTTVEVLHLREENFRSSEPLFPPNLDKCIALRELVLVGYKDLKAFPDLSNLRLLKTVVFEECHGAKEVVGLNLHMHLLMVKGCSSLSHIPGLGDLISLEELSIERCSHDFKQLPNLYKLTKLQRLSLVGEFKEVVGFKESMPLYDLRLSGAKELRDLHMLKYLQKLVLSNFDRSVLPQFDNMVELRELSLYGLPKVWKFPIIHQLSRLRRLSIRNAPRLEILAVGGLVALEELELRNCGTSKGRAELRDLHMLTNLQVLLISSTPIRSLPSLKFHTQLTELHCRGTQLAELPDLSDLILLEILDVSSSKELTSVGNLAILPSLEDLNVAFTSKLERLPDLNKFRTLRKLSLFKSGVRLSSEDIRVLVASKIYFQSWNGKFPWKNDRERDIEAWQSKYFATRETRSGCDIDCKNGEVDEDWSEALGILYHASDEVLP